MQQRWSVRWQQKAQILTCKRRKATAQSRLGMELTATVDRVAEGAPLDGCTAEHSNLLD